MSMLLFVKSLLWRIIGDSGFVVSSIVPSAQALLSFHLLTGKRGHARLHVATSSDVSFLKWRSQEIDLEQIANTTHRELLQGAIACGFEQFRQQVLGALDRLMHPKAVQELSPPSVGSEALSLCITGGPRDIALSNKVADIVENMGHVPIVAQP